MNRLCRVLALVLSLTAAAGARAGYLEDFYADAGAMSSVTPAGLYQANGMGLATGGSFVVKTPVASLPLPGLKAPKLSGGCGGIDIFLGAMSIPSREEFVSYLRGITTAIPGLAFQLALQSLSPDLEEQLASFRNLIRDYTRDFEDSCKAAETILNAGVDWAMTGSVERGKAAYNASGEASDIGEADRVLRTDGQKALSAVPARYDESGHYVEGGEVNLTWALLPGDKSGLSQSIRELAMSLVGTTVLRRSGDGRDAVLEASDYAPMPILGDYLTGTGSRIAVERLACDEPEKCLNPRTVEVDDLNLADRVSTLLTGYARALATHQAAIPDEEDLATLAGLTSLPVLRLAEIAAHPRFREAGENLLAAYSELVAYEILVRSLQTLAENVETAIAPDSGTPSSRLVAHAKTLRERLSALKEDLCGREDEMWRRIAAANTQVV